MPATELVLDRVCAGYRGTAVLEGVSLSLREGERVGIVGRNGAGKTTTLAAIMGLAECTGGRITLDGADLRRMAPHRRARAGIGFVPQTRNIFPSLSVEENLLAAMGGRRDSGLLDAAWRLFPRLRERRANGGNQLSGGEQQMLAVARALATRPRLLLLDEPLEGLAPQVAEEVMDAIRRLADETGLGCILVEQHVETVLDFASSVLVLERGLPAFWGGTEALRARPEVLESAIGLARAPEVP